MTHGFAERVWTGYNPLMRAQLVSFPVRLCAMFKDAQVRREYLGGFHVGFGEDGHLLHFGDEDIDEDCGGGTYPPQGNECGDIVVLVPFSAVLS